MFSLDPMFFFLAFVDIPNDFAVLRFVPQNWFANKMLAVKRIRTSAVISPMQL